MLKDGRNSKISWSLTPIIKEVNIVIDKNVRLYDLSGRQLKKLHKGLNIIDGKKVLVR